VALHEDVDDLSLLIDCSPQILIAAIDLQVNLIQMPGIANRASALFQALRILGTKLLALCPNRLVAHRDTALRHHFLNIAKAQTVPKVQPNTAADNLNRVMMAVIVTGKRHGIIRSRLAHVWLNLTMPSNVPTQTALSCLAMWANPQTALCCRRKVSVRFS
jgi:hypothetical protein